MYEKSKAINSFFSKQINVRLHISWAFNVERPLRALLLFFFFFLPFFCLFLISQLHFSTSLASLHQMMVRSWSSKCLLWILKGGGGYIKIKISQSQTHLLYKVMGRGFMLSCYDQNCTGNIITLVSFYSYPVTYVFLLAAGCHIVKRGEYSEILKQFSSCPYSCFRLDQGLKYISIQ